MNQYPYQNPLLPVEQRVRDLMQRMTLEQKCRQLTCELISGTPTAEQLRNGIGEAIIFMGPASAEMVAQVARGIQDRAMEASGWGIPALIHQEALSGPMVEGCAVFPTSLSLGATFAPELVEDMADRIRAQMVNLGIRQALSPVLDLVRDFRWGRTSEDYGSDPVLVSEMACAYVRGLQGRDLKDGVAATAKHFIGYSQTEGGINGARTVTDWRDLRENFARPFEAAIRKAGLCSVMNSYSEYDGEMITGSRRLLTELLREDLGFDGIVVSDYTSIQNLVEKAPIEPDAAHAGAHALWAGLDVELPMPYAYGDTLAQAVRDGLVEESLVDTSVARILTLKFRLGLFEKPYGEFQPMDNTDHDHQSAEVARKVMTLTKNTGILPITDKTRKIAVIGPIGSSLIMLNGSYAYPTNDEMFMALMSTGKAGMEGLSMDEETFGGATGAKSAELPDFGAMVDANIRKRHAGAKTVEEALRECFESVTYTQGCHVVKNHVFDFEAAEAAARDADIVILTVGGKIGMMVECSAGEGRDNVDVTLPGQQTELAHRVLAVNPNTVVVHTDNKPLIDPKIYEQAAAILEAWLPGPYGGNVIAEAISGKVNPGGKLPVDIPRHVGQTPVYYYQHPGSRSDTGMRGINPDGYGTMTCASQLPFGYGLSYTSFQYSNGKMRVEDGNGMPMITISIDVTNTGTTAGDEVVQLYGTDLMASVIRPQKELIGFMRVTLKPKQTKRVHLSFRIDQLAFRDLEGRWVVEKGDFRFYIGRGCNISEYETIYTQPETLYIDHRKRGFFADKSVELL